MDNIKFERPAEEESEKKMQREFVREEMIKGQFRFKDADVIVRFGKTRAELSPEELQTLEQEERRITENQRENLGN